MGASSVPVFARCFPSDHSLRCHHDITLFSLWLWLETRQEIEVSWAANSVAILYLYYSLNPLGHVCQTCWVGRWKYWICFFICCYLAVSTFSLISNSFHILFLLLFLPVARD